jgi:hypothetical protein
MQKGVERKKGAEFHILLFDRARKTNNQSTRRKVMDMD